MRFDVETLRVLVHEEVVDAYVGPANMRPNAEALLIDGSALFAYNTPHPWFNGMFQTTPPSNSEIVFERAQKYFRDRDRNFSLFGREVEDADLLKRAIDAGFTFSHDMDQMVLTEAPSKLPPLQELDVRCASTDDELHDFIDLIATVFGEGDADAITATQQAFRQSSSSNPTSRNDMMLYPDMYYPLAKYFVGYVDDQPVSTSMLYFSRGITGVHWVCTRADKQRLGYGRATLDYACAEGFRLGSRLLNLQALEAGVKLYKDAGFETVNKLQVLLSPTRT